jgi:hypothetical protein
MKAQAVEEEEEEAAQGGVGSSGRHLKLSGAAGIWLGFWRCRAT